MNSNEVIEKIESTKVIIIVRGVSLEVLLPLADALYDGGVRLMEITYSAHGEPTDEEVAANLRELVNHTKGRMIIGSGTVTRKSQIDLTCAAGASFIVSPDTNPEIISYTKQKGLVSIPGALTPSEITLAKRSGADYVKLFPANAMGASYLKAIKAPLSDVKILAVGGVDEKTIPEYLSAGASGFGIGTKFGNPALLREGKFAEITEVARTYVEMAGGK